MCHMIAAGLGIGVVPLAACSAQVSVLNLRVLRLKDAWATRRLLMATKTGENLSAAAGLLVKHLAGLSETDKGAGRG
jgi:DNA-binding transcriptional LysR family regulator